MNQEQFGGEGQGTPLAAGADDMDVNISNTGQRIRAILVVLIALGAAAGALYWYMNKQKEIETHELARSAFDEAHRTGYAAFWAEVQVDVKSFKTNQDFEGRLKQIVGDDPVRYAKYIKEKALPVWDEALPAYQGITAPAMYAEPLAAVITAAQGIRDSWSDFADKLAKYDDFFSAQKKLDDLGNAWLGAQDSDDPKFQKKAFGYFNLMKCIIPEDKVVDLEPGEVNNTLSDSCLNNKDEWFAKVAFECLPALNGEEQDPDEGFKSTIAGIRKNKEGRRDHSSVFAIKDCIKSTRDTYESKNIEALALAWAEYVKAQNAYLSAVDGTLKSLR